MKSFLDIFKQNKNELDKASEKARDWYSNSLSKFNQKAIGSETLRVASPETILKYNKELLIPRILPGEMYLFAYLAKWRKQLPYWDAFPLVFPFRNLPDGFLGINLHYLPYNMRVVLLDELMSFRNNSRMDDTTKLKLSWKTLTAFTGHKMVKPCVHRYLDTQLQSMFIRIPSEHWQHAILLPVERFQKSSKTTVWRDSIQ